MVATDSLIANEPARSVWALKRLGGTATAKAIREDVIRNTNSWAKSNIGLGLRRLVDLGYVEKLGDGRFRIVEEFQN